jgi:hypothetical protein
VCGVWQLHRLHPGTLTQASYVCMCVRGGGGREGGGQGGKAITIAVCGVLQLHQQA